MKCTKMIARVEKVDVLGWNTSWYIDIDLILILMILKKKRIFSTIVYWNMTKMSYLINLLYNMSFIIIFITYIESLISCHFGHNVWIIKRMTQRSIIQFRSTPALVSKKITLHIIREQWTAEQKTGVRKSCWNRS